MKSCGRSNRIAALMLTSMVVLNVSALAANDVPKAPSALIFGAREDAAPLSSRQAGRWTGYTVDLCRRIFDRYQQEYRLMRSDNHSSLDSEPTNLQVDFITVFAAERIEALENGRIDILCGATTVNIHRMSRVDFTLLTFVSGAGIMKKAQTDSALLKNPGRTKESGPRIVYVGCTDDMAYADCTTTETWLANRFGSAVKRLPKKGFKEAFEALRKDEADFFVGDRVILVKMLESAEDSGDFVLAPAFLTFEPYAIAIAKGNNMLLNVANAVLAELYRNLGKKGGINEIYDNYFTTKKSDLLEAMYQLQALSE